MLRFVIPMIILLAACSGRATNKTITQEQAISRVEELIRDTVESLNPKPDLELIPYSAVPNPCSYSKDGQPQKYTSTRAYWLRYKAKSAPLTIAQQVMRHWQDQGHLITSTGGFEVSHPSVGGKSQPDGYTLALVWTEGDGLYLAATSPCLWPDGKAPDPAG